jgi:hypothetical protein
MKSSSPTEYSTQIETTTIFIMAISFITLVVFFLNCIFGKCCKGQDDDEYHDTTNNGIYTVYNGTTTPRSRPTSQDSNFEHQPLSTVDLENLSEAFDNSKNADVFL